MTTLWDLFAGYEKAYGTYEVKRVSDKGKNEGRANTVREPIPQAMWEGHISGKGPGVGIIPLRSDNTVLWGCIDIDVIGIDHNKLEQQCRSLNLPLVICRSKSGGAHCFVFLSEPADARSVMDALAAYAASMGYGGSEIFPKQSSRYDEKQDIGNWLNMPYYFAERTTRYCIHNGQALNLGEFLEFAESMMVSPDALAVAVKPVGSKKSASNKRESVAEIEDGIFPDGPPCLQILHHNGGFPEGTRNDGMYDVAVYLKKYYPDDWQNKIQEYNVEMCDPPLPLTEINTIVKSMERKDYEYRCRKPPISSHCHRRLCLGRRCGVGESAEGRSRPEILDVKKVVGDPTIWFMTVNGVRLIFTTDELLNQAVFKRKIADAISRVPRSLPADRWDKYLDDLMHDCEVEYAPFDATPFGQFLLVLESYISGQARANTKEALATSNAPYVAGDGTVVFKLRGLIRHLDNQGFKVKSEHHLGQMLRKDPINAVPSQMNVKGKNVHIWTMKDFVVPERDDKPTFRTEEF